MCVCVETHEKSCPYEDDASEKPGVTGVVLL